MDTLGKFWLEGECVSGWVRDLQSETPLWVELVVDDCVLGISRADLSEPEGCGFVMPIPQAALESGKLVQVRIANTQEYFYEALKLQEDVRQVEKLGGECLMEKGLELAGWAIDKQDTTKIVRLFAKVNEKTVAETLACGRRYRPEQGDGHGFILSLPLYLADGQEHLVHIEDEKGHPVPGSPIRVCTLPQNPSGWLQAQNRFDPAEKAILSRFLQKAETYMAGSLDMDSYQEWKKAFPVPKIQVRKSCSVCVLSEEMTKKGKNALKQESIEVHFGSERPDYYLVLQGKEKLHPYALAHFVNTMRQSGADLVYADSENPLPLFKPCWDREFFFGQDYLGPILISRQLLEKVSPEIRENRWSEESFAALRVRLALTAEKMGGIRHLPFVLSTAPSTEKTESQNVEYGAARRSAIQAWLNNNYSDNHSDKYPSATVEQLDNPALSRIRYPLPDPLPKVSLLIPTRDQAKLLHKCLDSLTTTLYSDFEILILNNESIESDALELLQECSTKPGIRVLDCPGVFNYAAMNNKAAQEATGDLLCFLNNDVEILNPEWLTEMVSLICSDAAIGCVGAKLLWPNGLVQHGGVVVGVHDLACHVGNQWTDEEPGYMNRNLLTQQFSVVTAACLLTPKSLFLAMDGFAPQRFPVTFNDVDYCLRVRAAGKKVVWTPFAKLLHHESASRGKDVSPMNQARAKREMQLFRRLWGDYADPFYNPNLSLSTITEPFTSLALPPRSRYAR